MNISDCLKPAQSKITFKIIYLPRGPFRNSSGVGWEHGSHCTTTTSKEPFQNKLSDLVLPLVLIAAVRKPALNKLKIIIEQGFLIPANSNGSITNKPSKQKNRRNKCRSTKVNFVVVLIATSFLTKADHFPHWKNRPM